MRTLLLRTLGRLACSWAAISLSVEGEGQLCGGLAPPLRSGRVGSTQKKRAAGEGDPKFRQLGGRGLRCDAGILLVVALGDQIREPPGRLAAARPGALRVGGVAVAGNDRGALL